MPAASPNPISVFLIRMRQSVLLRRILRARRWLRACLMIGCLIGVATAIAGNPFMPREIREISRENRKLADDLLQRFPKASQTVSTGGRPIHFVQFGVPGRPLVLFLHGSPGSWSAWARYLADPELNKRARLVAVDRPGFGKSSPGLVEASLARQAADIAPLLELAPAGQRVIVVGHSFGGPLAVRLAMDHPGKVSDLVLLAGSIDPAQERTAWYQKVAEWPLLNRLVPAPIRVCNREIMALKADLSAMLPLWATLRQRVTVLQGDHDTLVPPANADFAQIRLDHASSLEIIRLPGANHFIPWNHYEDAKAAILRHLSASDH